MCKNLNYYGIKYSSDIELDERTKQNLALLTFNKPDLPIISVANLVNNREKISVFALVINQFHCEISDLFTDIEYYYEIQQNEIRTNENEEIFLDEDNEEIEMVEVIITEKDMAQRVIEWIVFFSWPTPQELKDSSFLLGLNFKLFHKLVYTQLLKKKISADKLINYLEYYSSLLTKKKIDKILDLYLVDKSSLNNKHKKTNDFDENMILYEI